MINFLGKQFVDVSVNPIDKSGNKAKVEGDLFKVSDETLFSVELFTDNPHKARIHSLGVGGEAKLEIDADALIGVGEDIITETFDLVCEEPRAVALGVAFSAVADEPVIPVPVDPVGTAPAQ